MTPALRDMPTLVARPGRNGWTVELPGGVVIDARSEMRLTAEVRRQMGAGTTVKFEARASAAVDRPATPPVGEPRAHRRDRQQRSAPHTTSAVPERSEGQAPT